MIEIYQAIICSDKESNQYMFGRIVDIRDFDRVVQLEIKEGNGYRANGYSHTWGYLKEDVKLIYRGG